MNGVASASHDHRPLGTGEDAGVPISPSLGLLQDTCKFQRPGQRASEFEAWVVSWTASDTVNYAKSLSAWTSDYSRKEVFY